MKRTGRPRRLFWRIYLYGLLLLVAVIGSVAIASRVLGPSAPIDMATRVQRYFDAEVTPFANQPATLQQKLALLHEVLGIEVAAYRANGERVAAAGDEVPGPLPEPPTAARHERRGPVLDLVVPLRGSGIYVVGHHVWRGNWGRWPLLLVVVLGVLALVSLPLARTLARPLERVTQAARALGAGDLAARTGLRRDDEVGVLGRAFDEMAARLERLVTSERELLANVSHELRTPLARIRIALELADEQAADPDAYRAALRGIAGDLAELEEIVEQVLMTARLDRAGEGGAPSFERAPLEIADLVAEAAARFAERHSEHVLATELAPALPAIEADHRMLRRVLDNLLDNAAKYSDPGPVELTATHEQAEVVLCVRDRGIGVDEADLPMLFEPFFRSARSRARGAGGVGLGLTLCRRVVEAHGGRIVAHSPPDGGLEVRVRLPEPSGATVVPTPR